MKTKTFILIAIAAIVTLSFTFASNQKEAKTNEVTANAKPLEGHVSQIAL